MQHTLRGTIGVAALGAITLLMPTSARAQVGVYVGPGGVSVGVGGGPYFGPGVNRYYYGPAVRYYGRPRYYYRYDDRPNFRRYYREDRRDWDDGWRRNRWQQHRGYHRNGRWR